MQSDQANPNTKHSRAKLGGRLWDFLCVLSGIGIWPRFIEPNLVCVTHLDMPLAGLPADLDGLRIAQLSDLHLNSEVSDAFLDRIVAKVANWNPDLVVFTGDFLCYSEVTDADRLKQFLQRFQARLGCYCIYGNHDYTSYVAVNGRGEYDVVEHVPMEITKGLRRIVRGQPVHGVWTKRLDGIKPQEQLATLLEETPFIALENETVQVQVGNAMLNICGVGEYIAHRFDPTRAFENYDTRYPGIVLAHNPDCIPHLMAYPGQFILCGHVHGGQLNLPWLRERFVVLEHPEYISGLFQLKDRCAYVNRGLGGAFRFRFFAPPELTFFTLRRQHA